MMAHADSDQEVGTKAVAACSPIEWRMSAPHVCPPLGLGPTGRWAIIYNTQLNLKGDKGNVLTLLIGHMVYGVWCMLC